MKDHQSGEESLSETKDFVPVYVGKQEPDILPNLTDQQRAEMYADLRATAETPDGIRRRAGGADPHPAAGREGARPADSRTMQ